MLRYKICLKLFDPSEKFKLLILFVGRMGFVEVLLKKYKKYKSLNISVKAFVLEAGIEPARPKTQDFESSASTNSATRANGRQK